MCKVFAMTNMSKVKINRRFLNSVRAEVCRTGDRHGFGYAVLSDDGHLSGERTMRPTQFQPLQVNPDSTMTGRLSCVLRTRDQFGELNFEKAKSFIAHGRYSTNDVALQNTHPFVNDSVALIHNGIVHDYDGVIPKAALKTTNDTEIILRCWERGGMDLVETTISGYYALAILDKAGLLHIVRDDTAPLYIAYCRTVDSYIFSTTAEIIKNVARKMKWSIEQPEEMLENVHVTWNRNEIVQQNNIVPRVDTKWSEKASAAFGTGESRSAHGTSYEGRYGSTYDGTGAWGYDSANVYDATIGKKSEAIAEEDEEPSYRESAQQKREQAALSEQAQFDTDVDEGDADRQYIDDGAPNVDARFHDEPDMGEALYYDIHGNKVS